MSDSLDSVLEAAPAKINLFLQAGRPGADGYHPLVSLVVFANVGDRLAFAPADDLELEIKGPFARALNAGPDNLIWRAAEALRRHLDIKTGARMVLQKALPVSAGLGGGSADAAAALRGLNRLWQGGQSPARLEAIAADLGADVPVCVQSHTRLIRGRGQVLQDVQAWPVLDAVLVNPGVPLCTAAVFARFDQMGLAQRLDEVPALAAHTPGQAMGVLQGMQNALTPAACAEAPAITALLEAMQKHEQTVLARLCGSGPTCMGIANNAEDAAALATIMQSAHPSYWVRAVRLGQIELLKNR